MQLGLPTVQRMRTSISHAAAKHLLAGAIRAAALRPGWCVEKPSSFGEQPNA